MRTKKPKPQIRKFRRFVLSVFMLGLLILSVGRIGFIYSEKSEFYAKQGDLRSVKKENIPALRGVIRDRNGEILALTTVLVSLGVDLEHLRIKPKMSESQKKLAHQRIEKFKQNISFIAKKINKSEMWILQKVFVNNNSVKFKVLARAITPQLADELKQRKIPALVYARKLKRFYPQGKIGASLIGFADFTEKGKSGIEASFDDLLSGTVGSAWVKRDQQGNAIDFVSLERAAIKGDDLQLTVDFRIQEFAYFALTKAMKKHKALKAAAVVLDATTGEILALESMPSYNPNDTKQRISAGTRNLTYQDLYEPGSTVKPLTVLAALEAGVIKQNQSLGIGNGVLKVANVTYRDSIKIKAKNISLGKMLQKSSNVGAIKVGLAMQPEYQRNYLHRLGFGEKPLAGLYGAIKGKLLPINKITRVDHASMSYGYGLGASLLQLARAYMPLANHGRINDLSIVKGAANESRLVASKANSDYVLSLLTKVVSEDGTAPRAKVPGFKVGGKTGTTRKFINGKYARQKYIGMFVGVAPIEKPELIIAVLIDEPRSKNYYGGITAAPVFAEIAANSLSYFGIKPDKVEKPAGILALNLKGVHDE